MMEILHNDPRLIVTDDEQVYMASQPADIANRFNQMSRNDVIELFTQLSIKYQVEVVSHLSERNQIALATRLPRYRLASIVSAMDSDDRADFFNRMPEDAQQQLLPALAYAEREDIRLLSSYAEGTAGSIMTSDYAFLAPDLSPMEAINTLRRIAPDAETVYHAYIVDETRKLIGTVSLRDLILAAPSQTLRQLMVTDVISVTCDTDKEKVSQIVAHYDLMAVPVTNQEQQLLGIITHDDILDVVQEEATEDMHKAANIGKLTTSLKDASAALLYKKRVVWLVLLVFGNIFSGAGIAHFEDVITSYVALVFFLPLLIDSGGNAGSQSATLMVRALATGEVELKDWSKMLGREVFVSMGLGLSMAAAVYSLGFYRGGPEIALVVGVSMIAIVMVGSLVGTMLPFVLHHLKLDPASASAPMITSIADISGVLIYFAIASSMLSL
ncbi:magnesium transporter [Thaumasiovibrio subtropicus]|uniref:magnesium transporter n=1 Tax=Thaumasiovibrio subtropicus TaxID=1891207 RepID=UPI000B35DB18|nr:magnesium transporter [Thaumasiovibrio subtropicus]